MRVDIPGRGRIVFEGRELSDAAKYFEFVPGYKSFPSDVRDWILNLKYAWSRKIHADSGLILQACDLIEDATYQSESVLLKWFQDQFPTLNPIEILQNWLQSVVLIRDIASSQEFCSWTIEPLPGEIDYFLKQCIGIIQMNKGFKKVPEHFMELLNSITTASEQDKINFIHIVTDSYSNPD